MMHRIFYVFFILASLFCLVSCAYTSSEFDDEEREFKSASKKENIQKIEYSPFHGTKTNIAVFPLGLSERTAKAYPHLLNMNVGLGLHNVLSNELESSGRFEMVEIEEEALKKILKVQWLSSSGMVQEDQTVETAKMYGAKKLVYGEVSDYAESKKESSALLVSSTTKSIKVSVEVRYLDIETASYTSASSTAYGFDWGNASEKAVKLAVKNLVDKLDKKNSQSKEKKE
ncbi:MAG: hypothetical protein HUU50_06520 [Candidatus Brocadiae bacterium]|nr:hypothetical protein [Candidatus Brocadiia bacterium]